MILSGKSIIYTYLPSHYGMPHWTYPALNVDVLTGSPCRSLLSAIISFLVRLSMRSIKSRTRVCDKVYCTIWRINYLLLSPKYKKKRIFTLHWKQSDMCARQTLFKLISSFVFCVTLISLKSKNIWKNILQKTFDLLLDRLHYNG